MSVNSFDLFEILSKIASFFIPFLFSLCFHEYAHGWVAYRKGDNTAYLMGRLSLNPLVHMDLLGTVFLPLLAIVFPSGLPIFGWAKPVPVNPNNLKNPKNDMFWIALAGPLSNILLACVGAFALVVLTIYFRGLNLSDALSKILNMFILVNLFLAFFNLIPLHPLDGGKIFARFLPYRWNEFLEENAMALNIGLLVFIIFGGTTFLAKPVFFVYQSLLALTLRLFGH